MSRGLDACPKDTLGDSEAETFDAALTQLLGSSQRPWMKTTGVLPEALAASISRFFPRKLTLRVAFVRSGCSVIGFGETVLISSSFYPLGRRLNDRPHGGSNVDTGSRVCRRARIARGETNSHPPRRQPESLVDKAGVEVVAADGSPLGPFNPLLLNPALGAAQIDVFRADKASSSLSRRVHEIVILVVGAAWGSEYELYAHGIVGRLAGLPADVIQALVSGRRPELGLRFEPGSFPRPARAYRRLRGRLTAGLHAGCARSVLRPRQVADPLSGRVEDRVRDRRRGAEG
jgi:hypothetical protein